LIGQASVLLRVRFGHCLDELDSFIAPATEDIQEERDNLR
jgi:hypothetical protein